MEIQKIFSDQYDEEKYYSVLMNEEELALFSEIQKEFASIRDAKKALRVAETAVANGGLTKGNVRTLSSVARKTNKGANKLVNNPELANKVLNKTVGGALSRAGVTGEARNKAVNAALSAGKSQTQAIAARSGKLDPWRKNLMMR